MKLFYILLDGVGDKPDPSLNWLTPLEAAYTPSLDLLARRSISGLVYPVAKGIAPESDIAVFGMLGYRFDSGYVGRGVVEAIGAGYDFRDGELALRGNFATLGEDFIIRDRRAGRDLSQQEAKKLADAVNKHVKLPYGAKFCLIPTVAHRNVLIISLADLKLSANITNTDPAYERVKGMGIAKEHAEVLRLQRSVPLDESQESKLSAQLVNEFTEKAVEVLKDHPVNLERKKKGSLPADVILLRDASNLLPRLKKLPEKFGLKFACIADMPVEKGVAKLTGMAEYSAGGVKDYELKAKKASELIKKYDVVYVHIKGPDEPGHDGDAKLKKRVIEEVDSRFFKPLVDICSPDEYRFVVSGDHSTPCQLKAHSDDPVPLIISGKSKDKTCRFTEREASKGSLGKLIGAEVLAKAIWLIKS